MTVATVLSKALLMWSLQSSKESVLYLIQQKRVQLLPQYDQQLGQLDENTRAYFTERTDWSFSPINDHPNPQATWWRCEFRKSRQAKQCETLSKTVHQTTPTTLNGQRLFSYLFFLACFQATRVQVPLPWKRKPVYFQCNGYDHISNEWFRNEFGVPR